MSYAPEVRTDNTGKWYGNAVRFETEAEAQAWVLDRGMRWTAVRDTRVVESDDPANYQWLNGRLMPITPVPNASQK